jgi:hypothetical protein
VGIEFGYDQNLQASTLEWCGIACNLLENYLLNAAD